MEPRLSGVLLIRRNPWSGGRRIIEVILYDILNEIFFCLIQASTYGSKSSIGVVCGLWGECNGMECRHLLFMSRRPMLMEFEKNNSLWKWTECATYLISSFPLLHFVKNSIWSLKNMNLLCSTERFYALIFFYQLAYVILLQIQISNWILNIEVYGIK